MLLVHYPVCPDPQQSFPLLSFDDAFGESSWESRLVLAVLEDDRVIRPSHHGREKGPGKSNLPRYGMQKHFKIPNAASPKAPTA